MTAPVLGGRDSPGLAGTGRLADDLYLIAHDDRTGKLRLAPRLAGLGLAAGLLAELLRGGLIAAGPLAITRTPVPAPRAGEALAGELAAQVAADGGRHGLRDWLEYLTPAAAQSVGARLVAAGYLEPARHRRGARLVPVLPAYAAMAVTRACVALDPARRAGPDSMALAGLAGTCGLSPVLAQYAAAGARRAEDLAPLAPPLLRPLLIAARAAADSAVLTVGL